MNERIKQLRKDKDLTQRAFGQRLGVTDGLITQIEKGEASITERMQTQICVTFGVNPLWLKNGVEPMYEASPETLIDRLAIHYNLAPIDISILKAFVGLSDDDRRGVHKLIDALVDIRAADANLPTEAAIAVVSVREKAEIAQESDPDYGRELARFKRDLNSECAADVFAQQSEIEKVG